MTRPLIGITGSLEPAWRDDGVQQAVLSPVTYSQAVERAGGVPVVLPPVPPRGVSPLVAGLDGLLITCGPALPAPATGPGRPADTPEHRRHTFELTLVRAAIGAGRPFLAVCRGLHALNAAQAGTLLPPQAWPPGPRTRPSAPAMTPAHDIQVSASSRLSRILGIRATVTAGHPHRLQQLGIGLLAVAWPDDQVIETVEAIEAVEVARHPFGLGVQWHAEEDPDLLLIRALVAAAATPAAGPDQARGAPAGSVPAARQAHDPVW